MLSLVDTLGSYVRWTSSLDIAPLKAESDFPEEFAAVAKRFVGYQWAKTLGLPGAHVFGIRRLGTRWPQSLAGIEHGIFKPQLFDGETPAPRSDDIDRFLVIELRRPKLVLAHLAMLVEAREWHLLDGQVMHLQ